MVNWLTNLRNEFVSSRIGARGSSLGLNSWFLLDFFQYADEAELKCFPQGSGLIMCTEDISLSYSDVLLTPICGSH